MKNLTAILLVVGLLAGCKTSNFTESGPEIEAFKASSVALMKGDYETYKALYADSAKIYFNNTTAHSLDDILAGMQLTFEHFSSYGYEDNKVYEFVTTSSGEQWLMFWGVFRGEIAENQNVVRVPIHITARFENGKIVEESGYWDNQIISNAFDN